MPNGKALPGERCVTCGRQITMAFYRADLATLEHETVTLPDGDSYVRRRVRHAFPCKGRSLRMRHVLMEWAAMLRADAELCGASARPTATPEA